jgi:LysR family transcriptional regulator, regulator for bpeEF and oprC
MVDLLGVVVFAKVVEQRSFSGAARALGMTKATVTRRIQALESLLGARLLERSTRRLSMTEAGATYYDYCSRIVADLEAAGSAVGRLQEAPRGLLRVTAPFSFGVTSMARMLPEFIRQFPELRVLVQARAGIPDLIQEGFDLAIGIATQNPPPYPSRLLGTVVPRLYASPGYLRKHGRPAAVSDLANHGTLSISWREQNGKFVWRLEAGNRIKEVQVTPTVAANSVTVIIQAAVSGLGIVLAPESFVVTELSAGKLVPVLPDWAAAPLEFRAFYPSRRSMSPKVRALIDFLVQRMAPPAARSESRK